MNKDQLRSRIHALREETGASSNTILTLYFLESILRRISLSEKRAAFVIKGGFLLSSSLGIRLRTTKDLDLQVQSMDLEPATLLDALGDILKLELDDRVSYEIIGCEPIRELEPYGGLRCKIVCSLENMKQSVAIDIAAGDPITPGAENYVYQPLFNKEIFSFLSVNIETILAEKFHTIISRGLANSRSKDFYDIYAIVRLKENQIDGQILKAAFENTFAYRKTPIHFDQFSQLLITIRENPLMNTRWNAFSRNNPFVSGTPFADTIQACSYLLELVKNAS